MIAILFSSELSSLLAITLKLLVDFEGSLAYANAPENISSKFLSTTPSFSSTCNFFTDIFERVILYFSKASQNLSLKSLSLWNAKLEYCTPAFSPK